MTETERDNLRKAILNLHGCESESVESVPVTETFQGQTIWEGTVQVFYLIGNPTATATQRLPNGYPTATRCYAWSHAVEGSDNRRFVAVLHQGPVNSPEKAVRAAIVQEQRETLS